MRVLSWNCNMAFRRKYASVQDFDPDVMIIQECEAPSVLEPYLGGQYRLFWTGENPRKGLGVMVRRSVVAESLDIDVGTSRYMLPVRIGEKLNVLAFWAMDDKRNVEQRYIGQVWNGLRHCGEELSHPCIVAGDFNWNLKFDKALYRKRLCGTMGDVVRLLREHHIISGYHALRHADFGDELDSTFHMHRRQGAGYHTDYVFLSEPLLECMISFEVGRFREWCTLSDHMPLLVDLL